MEKTITTISIKKELLKKARYLALERETSLSQIVEDLLEYATKEIRFPENQDNGVM